MMCAAFLRLVIGPGICTSGCRKIHQFAVKFAHICSISVCLHEAGPFFTSMEAAQELFLL